MWIRKLESGFDSEHNGRPDVGNELLRVVPFLFLRPLGVMCKLLSLSLSLSFSACFVADSFLTVSSFGRDCWVLIVEFKRGWEGTG